MSNNSSEAVLLLCDLKFLIQEKRKSQLREDTERLMKRLQLNTDIEIE